MTLTKFSLGICDDFLTRVAAGKMVTFLGEAKRGAPAQTELRPTCAEGGDPTAELLWQTAASIKILSYKSSP
jgi:hypothetical protein